MSIEFEVVDELPEGQRDRASNYDDTIQAFIRTVESGLIASNKWTVLKTSDNKESIAATTSGLKDRYGPVEANGLVFASRPYHADSNLRAIYMAYDPSKKVEGRSESYALERAAKIRQLNEKAKVRAQEKKKAKEAEGKGGTTPSATSEGASTPVTGNGEGKSKTAEKAQAKVS